MKKTLEELRKEAEDAEIGHDESKDSAYTHGFVRQIFRAGWYAAVKELTRLHDSKVELPDTDVEVLVKIDTLHNKYDIMKHNQHGWWQKAPGGGWCAPNNTPHGWRHIHELER